MHVILIPGLWLDGSSWDPIIPALEQAGHRAHPLTLPGLESEDTDRSGITVRDHVDAVTAAIDAVPPAEGKVVVVGHSMGAGIACAATDARTQRVARAVYVGGFPAADGEPLGTGFHAENGEIPLPPWENLGEEDIADLDDAMRAAFRERSVPSPERAVTDPLRLTDERRYDVPLTVVCPEFTGAQLQAWIEAGEPSVQEFTKFRDVEYMDLHTGHWPQFSRPDLLGQAIVAAADKSAA
ncbi:alpha/beta fold hydrolase [Jiangella asiatica]|uniref:Alpha/beta fold hydrolase n=1 Tax=Jiangella asiatica TaxID=2530372 RepID=A0A4R5D4J0_9ACTN|nr:alpha/beta fold hydrolase [Jiangella asiatica]TDE08322.1 alpha/beta fold hydrolase [Jiangella asiatica]